MRTSRQIFVFATTAAVLSLAGCSSISGNHSTTTGKPSHSASVQNGNFCVNVKSEGVSIVGDADGITDKDAILRLRVGGKVVKTSRRGAQSISLDQAPAWGGHTVTNSVLMKDDKVVASAEAPAGVNNWIDACVTVRDGKVIKISETTNISEARQPTVDIRLGDTPIKPSGEGVDLPTYAWYTLPTPMPAKGHYVVTYNDKLDPANAATADINLDEVIHN